MGVGDLLDETFRLYRTNFALFAGIVAVVAIPETLINMMFTAARPSSFVVNNANGASEVDSGALVHTVALGGVSLIITLLLSQLIIAALARAISDRYLGREVSVWAAYAGIGVGTFVTLVLALILQGFILFVGFLALLIPGIFFAIRFAFISQVIVLEHTGAWDALSRSWNLVRGSWWRVFGILLLVSIFVGIFTSIVSGALAAVLFIGHGGGTTYTVVSQALSGVAGIFVQPIQLGVSVLLYYDLRIRKEGFDLELMARDVESRQPV